MKVRPPRSRRWPLFVVALLLAHVGGMAAAVTIMVRHGQAAVIPDYYDKAVRFDEAKAARARAAAAAEAAAASQERSR